MMLESERNGRGGGLVWLAPTLFAVALFLACASLFWLLQRHETAERRNALAHNLKSSAEIIQLNLGADREYLLLLAEEAGKGALDAETFQARVSKYVADHPGLVNVTWADADFIIRETAPYEPNKQVVGLKLTLPEPERASRESRDTGKPVYTRPFVIIQGHPAFEVYVPIFREGAFLGTFGGIYSIKDVLRHAIPDPFAFHYEAAVTNESGNAIVAISSPGRVPDGGLILSQPLGPAGIGLSLRFSGYQTRLGWDVALMAMLVLCLTVCLGYSVWAQYREFIRRTQAEAALRRAHDGLERRVGERTRELTREIAERKAMEEARRKAEEELSRFFSVSPDLFCIAGRDGYFKRLNPSWEKVLGWGEGELLSKPFVHLIHPDDVAPTMREIERQLSGEPTIAFENRYRCKDGSYRWLEWAATPAMDDTLFAIARDVTEQKAMEAQLRQAQKMEAVGQLTGGVAHDFNNLLTVILGNLALLEEGIENEELVVEHVRPAMEATRRGAALTQRLLAFSRKQLLKPRRIDLAELVHGMTDLLRSTLGETVEIEIVKGDGLWPCEADPTQVENVLLNLALNARDAMSGGGRLTIETAKVHLDEDYAATHAGIVPGDYVLLSVSDTGCGMPPEVRERAFEPFFTTKEVGKGSGLGLSMVYGFIKQSGGYVTIESGEGEGTTVKIYLPRLVDRAAESRKDEDKEEEVPRGHGEKVLVVEDDDTVRSVAVTMLLHLGYDVAEAEKGKAALALLDDKAVELLLTDVILPGGMSGRDLAEEVRRRRPGINVLYMTGYTQDALAHHGRLDEGVHLIEKPFRKEDLARMVRNALDGGHA